MSRNAVSGGHARRKLALAVGFLSVAGAIAVAHRSPATGYELSIYTMTPAWVWLGLVVAMSVALAVAFVPLDRGTRAVAVGLAGLTMIVFVGLPIIRGYRFTGHYDALTHLGWARGISEGTMVPFDLFYPGIHTATVMVHSAFDVALPQAMMLVVLLTVVVFWVFVPLTVGAVTGSARAATIAAFAAFLLLPITTISMTLTAHAMSQAVMLSALLVYLFTRFVRADPRTASFPAFAAAFALTSVALVVYHPQLVAHLIVAFVAVCALQFLVRSFKRETTIGSQPTMYGQTVFLIGLFMLWSSNHGFFGGMIGHFVGSAVDFVFGDGGAGTSVASQGASISSIGGSLLEVFFKLFVPQLVFTVLAAGLALWLLVSRSEWMNRVRPETAYFVAALAGLVPLFFVYFAAPDGTMYFRVFGLIMVFVTILGAIGMHGLVSRLSSGSERSLRPTGNPVVAGVFAVLLTLSLVAIVPSPYIYKASPHVTDHQLEGYETAFDSQPAELQFVGLRNAPNRYDDAINANDNRQARHADLPQSGILEELSSAEEDRYLALSRIDHEREVNAYGELRYSESELDAVRSAEGVNRVQTNGEFELYYLHGNDSVGA